MSQRFLLSPIAVCLVASNLSFFYPTNVHAQSANTKINDPEPASNSALNELEVTKVKGASDSLSVLSPIDMRTSMRADLSETLSFLPSVRVDNTASSSLRQADLQPAEFSIRGAAPYQNNIQLDNASIDSLLDPGFKLLPGDTPSRTQVAGHSQSIFIDPSFMASIEVIDSNASAKEGDFTGGVVKSETRSYNGSDTFSISHRMTKDSWTEFHVDENRIDEFEAGAIQQLTGTPGAYQPIFEKSETAISGSTRLGDLGVFVGFSEKRAETSQNTASEFDISYFLETGITFKPTEPKDLDTYSRFLTVRTDVLDVDYDLYVTLAYSDYNNDSFLINFTGSDFTSKNEGLNLSVNYGDSFGDTRFDSVFAVNLSSNERDSEANTLDNYTGRILTTGEAWIGGYGDLESNQESISSKVDFSTPLSANNTLLYGADVKYFRLKQHRPEDYVESNFYPSSSTLLNSGLATYEDHHLYREATYAASDIAFNSLNLASYVELNGEKDRFFYRTGLRASYDDYLGNTNIAPRLSAGMFFDDEESSKVTVGVNRYYGKSFLSYKLRDEEKKFVTIRERESQYDGSSPINTTSGADQWRTSDLDTPFDDEFTLGFLTTQSYGDIGLKFVLRNGEDQVRTQYYSEDATYQYLNIGESNTKQIDLNWRSKQVEWASAVWYMNSSVSWMDSETDAKYIEGGYGADTDPEEQIVYEGAVIQRIDLPASDYATPFTTNIDIATLALNESLQINNRFTFTNGYQFLNDIGTDEETGFDEYEVEDQGSTFNWDLSVEYKLQTSVGAPYVRVDVINITNNDNVMRYESGVQYFSLGRQFWLEVGYNF